MKRVAVIGAGAAGLCAARYLSAKPESFEPVVFEKADCIGGTWVYTQDTGTDKHDLPIHSSMYQNLKANLPKEIMAFPDLPFDPDLPSFAKHKDILGYLEQYADKFALKQYIKFQTIVESVNPVEIDDKTCWEVTVRGLNSKATIHQFDAVMVCNGHYSVPVIPQYEGQETFEGKILHSHSYRKPEDFKGATVVCVGSSLSGQDIMLDISTHAKQVYVSHWKPPLQCALPSNVHQLPVIASIHGNKVTFIDGQIHEADYIILCTGYEYSFPFLSKDCGVVLKDNMISPLYKHLIHADFHTLSFIGLPNYIVPFPMFSCQTQLAISVLEGSFKLPSRTAIESENKQDLQKRLDLGFPHRYAHKMAAGLQWEYNEELSQLTGTVCPTNVAIEKLFDETIAQMRSNLMHCKEINYEIVNEEQWRKLP